MKCTNKKVFFAAIVLSFVLVFSGCTSFVNENNTARDIETTMVSWTVNEIVDIKDINFMNENVDTSHTKAACLYDITNDKILYSKDINEKLYPASTTKVLTALCCLKYGNLSDKVNISSACTDLEQGAVVCGFQPGDHPTLEQVLYSFVICSGNDAGIAIAEHISGSVEEFAKLMNKEAEELGLKNSHFVNPHGLHNKEHYTTLNDLYIVFKEAIKNDKFRDIISHKDYKMSFPNDNSGTKEITVGTTNKYFNGEATPPESVTVLGGKTGTTDEAGCCLVMLSKDSKGNEYIYICMKSQTHATVYKDMANMLNVLIK